MANEKFEAFLKIIETHPLVVFHRTYSDYVTIQLSTRLDDDDDAILLYLIDEGDGEFSLSDSAWIATLLPYEKDDMTDETMCIEAERFGFSRLEDKMVFYLMVTPKTLSEGIERFDSFVKHLQKM